MDLIKKIIPVSIKKIYHLIKKKMEYVPVNEKVSFNINTINDGHFNVTYRNIPTIRCPFDYVIYQMILSEVRPDLVIEIGTNVGGTTLYLADLMEVMGHGMIHSIDIDKHFDSKIDNHPRIKLFMNGWQKYDLKNAENFARILVIEDASHMYRDSLHALYKFSPIVTKGSYYIVEDGIVNALGREKGFEGGPLRAIKEFMSSNNDFSVDRKYCDLFGKNATFNVNGYLKKIK